MYRGFEDPQNLLIFRRYPMSKRYSKLNFKALLLVLIAIVMVAGFVSCKKRNQLPMGDFSVIDSPTGLIDDDGNVFVITNYVTNYVTNTTYKRVIITNRTYFPDKVIYMTNTITVTNSNLGKIDVITEFLYVDKIITNEVVHTNVVADTKNYISKWHNSLLYKVYAPWAGIGAEGDYKYTNLSYLDTKTLTEMWGRVVKMKSHAGQELTIRNRKTGTYFYFDDNLNIRWTKRPNEILKKFVQGLIIQYKCGSGTKGHWAIAGLYQLTKGTAELRKWNDTGVNILQGELFRWTRSAGEYDIIVLNPGHVIDGKEYGFEIYNTTYNYAYGSNPYFEERPENYMSKINNVTEAWKNWKPAELHDLTFQITRR